MFCSSLIPYAHPVSLVLVLVFTLALPFYHVCLCPVLVSTRAQVITLSRQSVFYIDLQDKSRSIFAYSMVSMWSNDMFLSTDFIITMMLHFSIYHQ